MPARQENDNDIYGEVSSAADLRKINRMIRGDLRSAGSREQVTELKRRSDYLCTLTRSPAWQTRFGSKADNLLTVAKDEDQRTTRLANQVAKKHDWDVEYEPWGTGK
jgi:hypothetical protein